MKRTKWISLLLTAVMLFSALPMAALATNNVNTLQADVVYGQTEARKMLSMINDLRKPGNAWYWNKDDTTKTTPTDLKDLTYDYDLEKVAMQRAAEIAIMYDHQRPNGDGCFSAYSMYCSTAGENIAWGYNMLTVAEEAFDAWSETDDPYSGQGHRRNMLNDSFVGVGIGHVIYNGRHYWVQEFVAPLTGAAYTEPADAAKTVNIPFSTDTIDMYGNNITCDWSFSVQSLDLSVGASAAIPAINAEVNNMPGTITDADCAVSPASVAKLENGKIVGVAPGTATLSATVCGTTKSIPVTVKNDAPDSSVALGDVDGDGEISAVDARLALRYSVKLEMLDASILARADMDGDGKVYSSDARLILRTAVGLERIPEGGVTRCSKIEKDLAAFTESENGLKYACYDDENDGLAVVIFADACTGMTAADYILTYNTDVLTFVSGGRRRETNGINETSNPLNGDFNTGTAGIVYGGMFFLNSLWSAENFISENYELTDVDFERLPMYTLRFRKLSAEDPQIQLFSLIRYSETTKMSCAKQPSDPTGMIPCAHTNKVNVDAVPASCVTIGYKAGVFCPDCGKYLSGHLMVPALGHTDADNDGVCDVCGADTAPAFALIAREPENGYIEIGINALNCTGLTTWECNLYYDTDDLTVVKQVSSRDTYASTGKDADAVGKYTDNSFIWTDSLTDPGQLYYRGYFLDYLWAPETFAEIAQEDGINSAVNAVFFECAVYRFKINDGAKPETALRLEGKTTGVSAAMGSATVSLVRNCSHTFGEWEIMTEATCTQDGVKQRVCTICKATETEAIAAAGHQLTKTDAKAATCIEAGNTAYYTCSVCKKTFSDETATKEIENVAVPALGHDYGAWTRLDDARHQRVCANDAAHIEKADHTWDAGKMTKAPTCNEKGVKTYTCTVCGATKTEDVAPVGHTEVADAAVPATCTTDGKTAGSHCSVCNAVIKAPAVVKATGHNYGDWTKLDDAQHQRVCANDAAHIEKADHTWDDGKVTKAATLEAAGETTFTCTVCGATKTAPIEKLQPVEIRDNTTDVVVSFAPEAFDKDVELKVQEVGGSTVVLTDQYRSMKVYDIAAYLGEEKIQPTAPVTVRIPVPQGFDAATIAVFHIGDDGKQEQLKITVENGVIVFTVNSFSHFVVVDTATKADFIPGDVDGNGKVESSDARLALRASVHLSNEPTDVTEGTVGYKAADYDGNGKVESSDARCILRVAVKLDPFG